MESKCLHRQCFVCGEDNPLGLGLKFSLSKDGECEAKFSFPVHTCGYPNRIQGGIVSAVLDSAMANNLLLRGIVAYTARLEVRFLKPSEPSVPSRVVATYHEKMHGTHSLKAYLVQHNTKVALAKGLFFEQPIEKGSL